MQNFRTYSVPLNQHQYDILETFPIYQVQEEEGRSSSSDEYRVINVNLKDGRELKGLLVLDDDLLVPDHEPEFSDDDILTLEATSDSEIPDFTITDAESLWKYEGKEKWIGHYDMLREGMFGPIDKNRYTEPDWRSNSIEECHAEALEMNRTTRSYGKDLPLNSYFFLGEFEPICLTPSGFRVCPTPLSGRPEKGPVVIRPQSMQVWREILEEAFEIDPETTFGDLLELLDLPEETARMVYFKTMSEEGESFKPWIEAARKQAPNQKEIAAVEVYPIARSFEGSYSVVYEASALGLNTPSEEKPYSNTGKAVRWSMMALGPATLVQAKLRYNPYVAFEPDDESWSQYRRTELLQWEKGDKKGEPPRPPSPFEGKLTITLKEFISALFSELPVHNWQKDEFVTLLPGDRNLA